MRYNNNNHKAGILFMTSYPPRECGIATYSQDLIASLKNKFRDSFDINICALESDEKHEYGKDVNYVFDTSLSSQYLPLAETINNNVDIKAVMIQHEFGFFHKHEDDFLQFLYTLEKPVVVTFHTVLPKPDITLFNNVRSIMAVCESVIVMTQNAALILQKDYCIIKEKIHVISHGTHLVPHLDKGVLKEQYGLAGKKVLSTFGLISSGKSIETTLDALPEIVKNNPEVIFLAIGKTHPGVVKHEGEAYREMLEAKVKKLGLQDHVKFINKYMALPELLEYLQLTDIYLFTSKDPNQAVSGTFSYAVSCGCPIISTPIPHAMEVLGGDGGLIVDFQNPVQLSNAVNRLLKDSKLRFDLRANALHRIVPSAWENSAIAHALVLNNAMENDNGLYYSLPPVNLKHVERLTTDFGMIQFAKINKPDLESGYTLDDNARAMVAMCMHFELTGNETDTHYIKIYLNYIKHCMQPGGNFLNYADKDKNFTDQNFETNLDDANGRAIWALGFLMWKRRLLPTPLVAKAVEIIQPALKRIATVHSTRALAFAIKGLYYYYNAYPSSSTFNLIRQLADRLAAMYKHESEPGWEWYESYLTYGNSILPESMLCAYLLTGNHEYKNIALSSFDFLISQTFNNNTIKVVSNKSWMKKGETADSFGEQPIDVAYTILALGTFYGVYKNPEYLNKMKIAFNWFLGQNHLHQVIYNPCTGGCYDGLEEEHINLNQGAESTVSYLMARLTIEKYFNHPTKKPNQNIHLKLNQQSQLI